MSDLGNTLRDARERRGLTRSDVAAALGADPADLAAIEAGRGTDSPLAARYAAHLGLDATLAPAVPPTRRWRDSSLIWIGAGALVGVVALAVFGGGLGSDSGSDGRSIGRDDPAATTTATAVGIAPDAGRTVAPAPAPRPAIDLRLEARSGRSVWVEIRREQASGRAVFAGIVDPGTSRRFTSAGPLWLGVAWAPNLKVSLNGRRVDVEGGTESYLVTANGLRRFTRR